MWCDTAWWNDYEDMWIQWRLRKWNVTTVFKACDEQAMLKDVAATRFTDLLQDQVRDSSYSAPSALFLSLKRPEKNLNG